MAIYLVYCFACEQKYEQHEIEGAVLPPTVCGLCGAKTAAALKHDNVACVSMKWSLWSKDRDTWEEECNGTWQWMLDAFNGTVMPRTVKTASAKEIRFGEVTFRTGSATIHFWTEFDNGSVAGPEIRTIEADDFEDLMAKIDKVEEELIEIEENGLDEDEEPDTITYDADADLMDCSCGNTASTDGFVAVDENGIECEPDEHWNGKYMCQTCGATIVIPKQSLEGQ